MLGSALEETLRAGGAEVLQRVRRQPAHCGEMQWEPGKKMQVEEKLQGGVTAAIHLSGPT